MDLKELENGINPDVHWYYQSKKLPLFNYTKKTFNKADPLTIVDVGSGSGFFVYELEKNFPSHINKAYMVDIGYTEEEMAKTRGEKIEKTHFIPPSISNSLVILMDVLEHIEDDFAMLQSIKKAATGGNNYFFITVPAFKSLWSGHDDYLGHYRRYKINTLGAVLKKAGFTTTNTYYLYGSLFPMVYVARKLNNITKKEAYSNMKPFNKLTNSILLGVTSMEMKITSMNKMFGMSVVAEGTI